MHGQLSAAKAQGSAAARSVLLSAESKCAATTRHGIQDSIVGEFVMTEPAYDLLIRGGRVATMSDVFEADVAISGENIVAAGAGRPGRRGEIDAVIHYAFNMIIADPTRETLESDLPALIKQGHGSIKIFMTYDRLKIDDEPLLDILLAARDGGAMLCAHAENHGIISWMVKRLLARGYTDPKYHAISHARVSEAEAFNRLIGRAR